MNIFKINKCKKNFFEKFPFFRGVALIKKNFFGQNFFAHVSGKNKTFVKNVPHFGRFRENPSEMGYGNEVFGMRNISSMVQC